MDLTNNHYQINIKTVWEDNTQIFLNNEEDINNFIIEEENEGKMGIVKDTKMDLNDKKLINLDVKMPEYFGYSINCKGNIEHINTEVSSKLYGDVNYYYIFLGFYQNIRWGV